MTNHAKEPREEWLAARLDLLAAEKELTRGGEVARERQAPGRPTPRADLARCADLGEGREFGVSRRRRRSVRGRVRVAGPGHA